MLIEKEKAKKKLLRPKNLSLTKIKPILLVIFSMMASQSIIAQNCHAGFKFAVSGCNTVVFTPDSLNANYSYTWDFGDGKSSNLSNPIHEYIAYGAGTKTFTVKLTTSSRNCTSSSFSQTVEIKEIPDPTIGDKSGKGFVN